MARGISLHIGLNRVDLSQYPGYQIPVLSGCINDANSMCAIAKATGFATTTILTDQQGTAMNIKNKISEAAGQLCEGDIFFLTYSGHGSQVPDESGEEDDGNNETWVCYDRQLIDDELYTLWQSFKENVRIFVLSDSCHSGTMVRMLISDFVQGKLTGTKGVRTKNFTKSDADQLVALAGKRAINTNTGIRKKTIPLANSLNNYLLKKELYQNIQQLTKSKKDAGEVVASLIYISGCQDNQTSGDGPTNGVFTGNLLSVWSNGSFTGDYQAFFNRILAKMPSDQTPNYMKLGLNNDPFEAQKPFTILPANTGNNTSGNGTSTPVTSVKPEITGPSSWCSSSLPPTFNVVKGSNPHYYVEVATDYNLFNDADHDKERNDTNFFATWGDASNNYKLFEDPQYQLPQEVWDKLKTSEKIYYRLGTTIDADWNGWMVTVEDEHAETAPYFCIVQDSVSTGNDASSGDNTSSDNTGSADDSSSSNDNTSSGDASTDNTGSSDNESSGDAGSSGGDASSEDNSSDSGSGNTDDSDTETVNSDKYLMEV